MTNAVTGRMRRNSIGYDAFVGITDARVLSIRPGPDGSMVVTFDRELDSATVAAVWWYLTSSSDEEQASRIEVHGALGALSTCLAEAGRESEPLAACVGEALEKVGRLLVGVPPSNAPTEAPVEPPAT